MSVKQKEDTLKFKNRLVDFDLRETIFVDANIFIYHASANHSYGKSCEAFLQKVESKNIATRDSDFERANDVIIWYP